MKTSFRARRKSKLKTEKTYKLITFRLRQHWFALPIEALAKVIITDKIYPDPIHKKTRLTKYKNQEIIVIDGGDRIFSDDKSTNQEKNNINNQQIPQHLIILNNTNEQDIFGLPIDSPPSIIEVGESSFKTLPEKYLQLGKIKSVSSLIIEQENQPPHLILSPEKLIIE